MANLVFTKRLETESKKLYEAYPIYTAPPMINTSHITLAGIMYIKCSMLIDS